MTAHWSQNTHSIAFIPKRSGLAVILALLHLKHCALLRACPSTVSFHKYFMGLRSIVFNW
uniref:Uncharacterized protein n=1 Tax=Lepeophtheirus salmonis TaxID=72036 RepID=A0A0K2TUZ4_LEPSM